MLEGVGTIGFAELRLPRSSERKISAQHLAMLRESILKHGYDTCAGNITVIETEVKLSDGSTEAHYRILDGAHRYLAVKTLIEEKRLELPQLPAIIYLSAAVERN